MRKAFLTDSRPWGSYGTAVACIMDLPLRTSVEDCISLIWQQCGETPLPEVLSPLEEVELVLSRGCQRFVGSSFLESWFSSRGWQFFLDSV